MKRSLYRAGSVIFAGSVMLAIFASIRTSGLVSHLREDGSPVFYRESPGSIAGQDEYLFFVVLWIPSLMLRLVRAGRRPWMFEIALFALASIFVYVGWTSVGTETLRRTAAVTGDPWIGVWVGAVIGAAAFFPLLSIFGWTLGRRPCRA